MSGRRGSDPVLVVGAAVAALAGGVIAVAVLAAVRDIDRPALVAAVVGGAVLLSVVAAVAVPMPATGRGPAAAAPSAIPPAGPAGTVQTAAPARTVQAAAPARTAPARAPARTAQAAAGARTAPAAAPVGAPAAPGPATPPDDGFSWAGRSGAEAEPEPERRTRQWWTEPKTAAGPDTGPVVADAGPLVPPLDLPEQPAGTRIVQCPRCGDERVDIAHERGGGFAFDCVGCGNAWSWQAGAPWPVAVVRPRLRRPAGPDSR